MHARCVCVRVKCMYMRRPPETHQDPLWRPGCTDGWRPSTPDPSFGLHWKLSAGHHCTACAAILHEASWGYNSSRLQVPCTRARVRVWAGPGPGIHSSSASARSRLLMHASSWPPAPPHAPAARHAAAWMDAIVAWHGVHRSAPQQRHTQCAHEQLPHRRGTASACWITGSMHRLHAWMHAPVHASPCIP